MIVTQIDSNSGHLVAFVWLHNKRFSGSVHDRSRLNGPALDFCEHEHREQETAERCVRSLLRRADAEYPATFRQEAQ